MYSNLLQYRGWIIIVENYTYKLQKDPAKCFLTMAAIQAEINKLGDAPRESELREIDKTKKQT